MDTVKKPENVLDADPIIISDDDALIYNKPTLIDKIGVYLSVQLVNIKRLKADGNK